MNAAVTTQEEVFKLAQCAAAYYTRVLRWREPADLVQEAIVALLQAAKTFDPTQGVSFRVYGYKAAMRGLRHYLWKNRKIVSAKRRERDGLSEVRELCCIIGAKHPDLGTVDPTRALYQDKQWYVLLEKLPGTRDPEEKLAQEQLRKKIRRAVCALDESNGLALSVVFDEKSPREVAKENRVSPQEVYYARKNLQRRIEKSSFLRHLNKEMAP